MARRNTLNVPAAESSGNYNRRRSAGDRPNSSTYTPRSPRIVAISEDLRPGPSGRGPGSSKSLPICIDVCDEGGGGDEDHRADEQYNTKTIEVDTPLPQRSSVRTLHRQQSPTPKPTRTAFTRGPSTDPGPSQKTSAGTYDNEAIPFSASAKLWPHCRVRAYTYRGRYNNHYKTCLKCQEMVKQEKEEKEEEERNVVAHLELEHVAQESRKAASVVARDSNDAGGSFSDDAVDETNKRKQIKKHGQESSALWLHSKIITIAKKPLSKADQEGHIYIFRDNNKKAEVRSGLVKIGMSTSLPKRMIKHGKCGLDVELLWDRSVISMKRVEQLIKADMGHLCREWKCSHCVQTHTEWFQIDIEKAKRIVNKWSDWIYERQPYGSDGILLPIWSYLMDWGRGLPIHLQNHDHEARWAHWEYILSPPSSNDTTSFERHMKIVKQSNGKSTVILPRQLDKEKENQSNRQQTPGSQNTRQSSVTFTNAASLCRTLMGDAKPVQFTVVVNNYYGEKATPSRLV